MTHKIGADDSDPVLAPFLEAGSELSSDELLSALINEHADPIIRKILKSRLRVSLSEQGTEHRREHGTGLGTQHGAKHGSQENQDALEIAGDLRASLISALRTLRQNPNCKPIVSFPNFVAIKTYSACADYFREKHPQRWRLKNQLRRHLRQNPQFALWQAEDQRWYAGFNEQQNGKFTIEEHEGAQAISFPAIKILDGRTVQPGAFLAELFERSSGPIDFNRVVTIAAETWDIHDRPVESIDAGAAATSGALTHPAPEIDLALEQRLFLKQVWGELSQLPVLQRAALLLNLRDSSDGSVISFLPFLGIASKEEIAQLLEIPDEEFQELWSDLPIDDAAIARIFGITRQQVINLRKTARERLTRRMRKGKEQRGKS